MKIIFLIIASMLTLIAVIPYVKDILKGTTKPNIVSWITWTLLTGVATAAEISAHEYVTAIFTGSAMITTGIIVVLGLRRGYVKYTSFDVACQIGAVVGLIIWQIFGSPELGVIASVMIDFIGALPTIRHSWKHPDEETWQTYGICAIGGVFAIAALSDYNWVSLPYAVYIVLINVLFVAILIGRGKRKGKLAI
jgi:hypothetical protein